MIPFFFTKQDGGRRRGEELRERYSCDSCDSCDSFQRRGIWIRAAFKLLYIKSLLSRLEIIGPEKARI